MIRLEKEYLERVRVVLKQRRVALRFSQIEVSRRTGIPVSTVRYFEQKGNIAFYNFLKLLVLYRMDHKVITAIEDRSYWTVDEHERAETRKRVR